VAEIVSRRSPSTPPNHFRTLRKYLFTSSKKFDPNESSPEVSDGKANFRVVFWDDHFDSIQLAKKNTGVCLLDLGEQEEISDAMHVKRG
jgi:hypothetical protein